MDGQRCRRNRKFLQKLPPQVTHEENIEPELPVTEVEPTILLNDNSEPRLTISQPIND